MKRNELIFFELSRRQQLSVLFWTYANRTNLAEGMARFNKLKKPEKK